MRAGLAPTTTGNTFQRGWSSTTVQLGSNFTRRVWDARIESQLNDKSSKTDESSEVRGASGPVRCGDRDPETVPPG